MLFFAVCGARRGRERVKKCLNRVAYLVIEMTPELRPFDSPFSFSNIIQIKMGK